MGRSAATIALAALVILAVAHVADAKRRSCGTTRTSYGIRFKITIEKGHVRCRTARKVLRAFLEGKGTLHGPRNGPASKQTWTLYGWRCGHGAGGGGCIRHGRDYQVARDYIIAISR